MTRTSATLSVIAAVALLALPAAAEPAVGEAAPDFLLKGSDGKLHTLAQYQGEQAVVLAWFPKAFTPG